MTLGEVMRFKEGQVLELSRDLISDTRIRLSNTEEFLGTAGVRNGQIAVHLTKRIVKAINPVLTAGVSDPGTWTKCL